MSDELRYFLITLTAALMPGVGVVIAGTILTRPRKIAKEKR